VAGFAMSEYLAEGMRLEELVLDCTWVVERLGHFEGVLRAMAEPGFGHGNFA